MDGLRGFDVQNVDEDRWPIRVNILDDVEWAYPEKTVRLLFFRCALKEEPRAAEGQEIAWVEAGDLDRYEFPPADAGLVTRLRRR